MGPSLRDISVISGEGHYDSNGEIVLGGKGTALIKNPTKDEVAIFQVNKLGWLGDHIAIEQKSLQPGTETKVGGDGTGYSVTSLNWKPTESAPTGGAPQAQPPIATDVENVGHAIAAAAQGITFWVILLVVLLVLGYFVYLYFTAPAAAGAAVGGAIA